MKKTRDDLIKENTEKDGFIITLRDSDHNMRSVLSKILGSIRRMPYEQSEVVVVLSWMEIAFKIGEIKAIADRIEFELREENGKLRIELDEFHRHNAAQKTS